MDRRKFLAKAGSTVVALPALGPVAALAATQGPTLLSPHAKEFWEEIKERFAGGTWLNGKRLGSPVFKRFPGCDAILSELKAHQLIYGYEFISTNEFLIFRDKQEADKWETP